MNVYLIGPATPEDYTKVATALDLVGHDVFIPANGDLRMQITGLLHCEAIVLMDAWWSDRTGICLQTLSAWLGMKVFDQDGKKVSTSSLRG